MKRKQLLALCFLATMSAGYSQMFAASLEPQAVKQQTETVKGTVTDEKGEPLIGVSVIIKGQNTGVITDIDGNFTLNVKAGTPLEFSYIGYEQQTVTAQTGSPMRIKLNTATEALDEVVVVGYGTMRRRDVTGSIASISSKDINTVSSANVSQMLQGKVAGMNAIQSSAQPGASVSINIRGAVSPNGGNSPLYVIDGVPMQTNTTADPGLGGGYDYKTGVDRDPLNSINPNDIESIEVLKDASAAAIYGASAANGVILITTKNGKSGKPKVDWRSVYTTQIKNLIRNCYVQKISAIKLIFGTRSTIFIIKEWAFMAIKRLICQDGTPFSVILTAMIMTQTGWIR